MKDKNWRKRVSFRSGFSGSGWYPYVDDKELPWCQTKWGAIRAAKHRIKSLDKGFTYK
jgi:hypothetical protein